MRLTKASLPAALRKLLVIGVAAGAAAASVVIAGVPAAQGSSGGTVEHWGAFLGDGSQTDRNLSPAALSLPAPVAELGSSNDVQYALLTNGTVYAWGQGGDGELGDGGTVNSFTAAVQVKFPAGVKIASIPSDVMPFDSAFAVDTTGHVWGWGLNQGSEFCLGTVKKYLTPVELPFSGVTTLAGAADHATYDANGTLYSCGINQYGELGNGTTKSSKVRVKVSGLSGHSVATLVAAWGNTGALLSNGDYYDWGYDGAGQVGNGTISQSAEVPVQVALPGPVAQAAQGGSLANNGQTLVLLSNGSLYAWGNDRYYQLGDGKTASEESPELISPPSGVTYQTLATGGDTSYAISTSGDVYAWGNSATGQVGNGKTKAVKEPVMVETGATLISSTSTDVVVSAGG